MRRYPPSQSLSELFRAWGHAPWSAAFAALLLIVACGPAEPNSVSDESLPEAVDLPPGAQVIEDIDRGLRGGQLVSAMADEPKTFNPPLASDVLSVAVSDLMFDRLFDYDRSTQEIEPELAESWMYESDRRRWVFYLRDNIFWSDGAPITADDFLFATEVIFDPSVPSQFRDLLQVDGKPFTFEAPNERTFVVNIPAVDSTALLQILNIQALPRGRYETSLRNGTFPETLNTDTPPGEIVSSGPWVLKEYISGDRLVFARNPHYYRYDRWGTRLPYLDQFVLLSVPDFDAMSLRFQSGDLDMIEDPIQPQNLVVLQDGQDTGDYTLFNPGLAFRNTHYWFNLKPGGTYVNGAGQRVAWEPETPGQGPPAEIRSKDFRYYVAPHKQAWFNNPDFRRACSMATNRPAIVRTIYYGEAEPLYGFASPANKFWYNPEIPKYPYDPEAAAALLESIGMRDRDGDGIREDPQGNPIRFNLITNKENKIRERIAVLLQEDLGKLGLDVNAQVLDFNHIISRLGDTFDYEACLLGLSSGVPPHPADASNVLLSNMRLHQWNPQQKTPATEWEARIDALYHRFRTSFDEVEQQEIYDEIQAIWAENQPMIHLVVDQLWIGASNRIGNLKPAVLRPYLTHNLEELYLRNGERP